MEDNNYNFTDKDKAAINAIESHETKTNIEYINDVLQKINLLAELVNSLHEENIQMKEWLCWSEPLIHKLIFHSSTLLKIFFGTEFLVKETRVKVFDEPSAIILLRTVLENYLTFHYLYIDNVSDEEKIFRINVWQYCGLKQRTNFTVNSESSRSKQARETVQVGELKDIICNSDIFSKFKTQEQKEILKGRKARLSYSWEKLIESSGFRKNLFRNLYGYKSNYAHSEFISVLQIKSKRYGFNALDKEHYILFLLHIIICKCIVDLKNLFPTVRLNYETKEKNVINEIEFFYQFAVDPQIDLMDITNL